MNKDDSLLAPSNPDLPFHGPSEGLVKVRTVMIWVEAAAVAVIPWVRLRIASEHGHPVRWTADFPTSIARALLVDLFAVMSLIFFTACSRQLQRRLAGAAHEAEARLLDQIRSSLSVLTQTLFFLALLLSPS